MASASGSPALRASPRDANGTLIRGRVAAPRGQEELALCVVCEEGDWEEGDAIIFCDGCDIPVHQQCYGSGARRIPEGNWYCDACAFARRTGSRQPAAQCHLCPMKGGALKRTSDFRWAHIVCGLWVPEIEFLDAEGRDVIHSCMVNEKRFELTCSLCDVTGGANIQCRAPRCLTAFHASCARRAGVHMVEKEKQTKEGEEYVELCVLCDKHRPADGPKKKRKKRDVKW